MGLGLVGSKGGATALEMDPGESGTGGGHGLGGIWKAERILGRTSQRSPRTLAYGRGWWGLRVHRPEVREGDQRGKVLGESVEAREQGGGGHVHGEELTGRFLQKVATIG